MFEEDCPEDELTPDELQAMTYYNEAIYHREHKNWPDYVFNLLWACELGNIEAEKEYYNLNNLPDFTGLLEMIQIALDKNPQHSYFITFLGYMYDTGQGVVRNETKAEELYTQGVELGNNIAMYNLASMHHLNKKYNLARELYEKAANLNNTYALIDLGRMHLTGQGSLPDPIKAKEYYKKAIKLGSLRAKTYLGHMYLTGSKHHKAKELFESAGEHGDFIAMNNLASMYQKGTGVVQDYEKARNMLELAGEHIPAALFNLGFIYFKGHGWDIDYIKARELFEKTISHKNSHPMDSSVAAKYLAIIYKRGLGVLIDEDRAQEYTNLCQEYKKN